MNAMSQRVILTHNDRDEPRCSELRRRRLHREVSWRLRSRLGAESDASELTRTSYTAICRPGHPGFLIVSAPSSLPPQSCPRATSQPTRSVR
jgi:hypothetical protein